jgi:palmitoyl-protein thioesterase
MIMIIALEVRYFSALFTAKAYFCGSLAVVPRDSSWFSWFNGTHLVPLVEQPLYLEDWLGLKELDDSGRLVFAEVEGEHMQFSFDWFEAEIIDKYFRTSSLASTSA